jgi:hypothetical protein
MQDESKPKWRTGVENVMEERIAGDGKEKHGHVEHGCCSNGGSRPAEVGEAVIKQCFSSQLQSVLQGKEWG